MGLKAVLKLAYSLVAVILLIGGMALWSVNTLSNSAHELQGLSSKKQAVADLKLALTRVVMPGNDYLITGSPEERTLHNQLDGEVSQSLANMRKYLETSEEEALLGKVSAKYQELKRIELQILAISDPIGSKHGGELMEEMDGIADQLGDILENLEKFIYEDESTTIDNVMDQENEITTLVLLVTIIALLGVILVCVAIRGTIINTLQPLKALVEKVRLIAAGDMTVHVDTHASGEIGELVKEFNSMVHKLKDLILAVTSTAHEVALTSENLAINTEMANKATEEVAKAICEVAKGSCQQAEHINNTIENMKLVNEAVMQVSQGNREQEQEILLTNNIVSQVTESMRHVAVSSQTVACSAEKTKEAADKGGQAVALAISEMERIRSNVLNTAQQVAELGERSDQIGEIIRVIDDIWEQTNLLALNAAIEASRAGEHGKGFAVVAEEVRKLAQKSSSSTKEITNLIRTIQTMTNNVVDAMDNSTKEAENGAKLAEDAGIALKEIMISVGETYQQVQNISLASKQIAANSNILVETVSKLDAITNSNSHNVNEINRAQIIINEDIEHIACLIEGSNAVAQEVSAGTEETLASVQEVSASAEVLASTAGTLKTKVSIFKV